MESVADTTPHIPILKAGREDATSILACLVAAFEEYRDKYSAEAFADTILDSKIVEPRLSEMCELLAMAEERVVGTISWSVRGAEGHLRGMVFFPDWRGAGVVLASIVRPMGRFSIRMGLHVTIPVQRILELENYFVLIFHV